MAHDGALSPMVEAPDWFRVAGRFLWYRDSIEGMGERQAGGGPDLPPGEKPPVPGRSAFSHGALASGGRATWRAWVRF